MKPRQSQRGFDSGDLVVFLAVLAFGILMALPLAGKRGVLAAATAIAIGAGLALAAALAFVAAMFAIWGIAWCVFAVRKALTGAE